MERQYIRLNRWLERCGGLHETGLPIEFAPELNALERRIGSLRSGPAGYVTLGAWFGFFILPAPAVVGLGCDMPYLAAACGLVWAACCWRVSRACAIKKGHPNG